MTRRRLLSLGLLGGAATLIAGNNFLNNMPMKEPPVYEGKIIADLHTHPRKNSDLEELLRMFSRDGIIAVAHKAKGNRILTYEDAITLPGVDELETGLLASLTFEGQTGYFLKAQEVAAFHHIVAIGCRDYLPDDEDPRTTVEKIHKQGGLAILPHPFIVPTDGINPVPFRLATEAEEGTVRELCQMVDEIESFNATSSNILPFVAWYEVANHKAQRLADGTGKHTGIAVTDARLLHQVRKSGIYLPREISMEAILRNITHGGFPKLEQYHSRMSLIKSST